MVYPSSFTFDSHTYFVFVRQYGIPVHSEQYTYELFNPRI